MIPFRNYFLLDMTRECGAPKYDVKALLRIISIKMRIRAVIIYFAKDTDCGQVGGRYAGKAKLLPEKRKHKSTTIQQELDSR